MPSVDSKVYETIWLPGVMLWAMPDTIRVCVSVAGVPTTKFLTTVAILVMSRFSTMFWSVADRA